MGLALVQKGDGKAFQGHRPGPAEGGKMPTLIPDFARAIAESNRQAAASVDEAARRIERLRERAEKLKPMQADLDTVRRRWAREARSATRDLVAGAEEMKDLWSRAVQFLRQGLSAEEQITVLQLSADLAASGHEYREAIHRLWAAVEQIGGQAEGAEELAEVGRLFDRVIAEATRAIEVRKTPWKPSDPARLEQGLEEIRQGKAVSPDEARARFRKDGA
jgi:hypothetical protein